jgi:hypothetical protein
MPSDSVRLAGNDFGGFSEPAKTASSTRRQDSRRYVNGKGGPIKSRPIVKSEPVKFCLT